MGAWRWVVESAVGGAGSAVACAQFGEAVGGDGCARVGVAARGWLRRQRCGLHLPRCGRDAILNPYASPQLQAPPLCILTLPCVQAHPRTCESTPHPA